MKHVMGLTRAIDPKMNDIRVLWAWLLHVSTRMIAVKNNGG